MRIFKRKGYFFIPRALLQDGHDAFLIEILHGCIIIKAEYSFMEEGMKYWAYNACFDEIPIGDKVPEYRFLHVLERTGQDTDRNPEYIHVFKGWEKCK